MYVVVLYSIIYGVAMKIADLLNEHGLKWFKYSDLFLGIIWGVFGALILPYNINLANVVLAMNLVFVVRNRLDYINHQIASSIIIITFLYIGNFKFGIFILFYTIFFIFGAIRDYIGDKVVNKNKIQSMYDNFMWYYPVPTFIWGCFTQEWIIFIALTSYTVSYDVTKYIFKQYNYK